MTTRWYPAARSALAIERIPPSMNRRSPMVTGGQHPGHRAAGADRVHQAGLPPAASNTTNSPVRASTAVTFRDWAGQPPVGSRASITLRRSASGMVRAPSGDPRPARTESRLVLMTQTSLPMMPEPIRAGGSGAGGASWAWYSASSSYPQAMSPPTTEPAHVPMITSAAARSTPSPGQPGDQAGPPGNAGDTAAAQHKRASAMTVFYTNRCNGLAGPAADEPAVPSSPRPAAHARWRNTPQVGITLRQGRPAFPMRRADTAKCCCSMRSVPVVGCRRLAHCRDDG